MNILDITNIISEIEKYDNDLEETRIFISVKKNFVDTLKYSSEPYLIADLLRKSYFQKFYVDLSECNFSELFGFTYQGVFVNIYINEKNTVFALTIEAQKDKRALFIFEKLTFEHEKGGIFKCKYNYSFHSEKEYATSLKDIPSMIQFIFRLTAYLNAENRNLTEKETDGIKYIIVEEKYKPKFRKRLKLKDLDDYMYLEKYYGDWLCYGPGEEDGPKIIWVPPVNKMPKEIIIITN